MAKKSEVNEDEAVVVEAEAEVVAEAPAQVAEPKVTWLKHQLPAVNSKQYWKFRKANENATHQVVTATRAAAALPKTANRQQVIEYLCDRWDTDAIAALKDDSDDQQILQYLGQLSFRGWNRLVNSIMVKLSVKVED